MALTRSGLGSIPRRRIATVLSLLFLAGFAFAQDFYEAQLRVGESSLSAGQFRDASDNLRIAAFGLLDRPALLCEALAQLALADQGAGRPDAVDQTLRRMVGIARLLPECRQASLDPGRRKDFEDLARRRLGEPLAQELLSTAPAAATVKTAPKALPAVPTPVAPVANQAPTPPPPASPPTPTAVPAPPVSSPTTAREATDDLDRQPQIRSTTKPIYPVTAERAGVGGIVLLKVLVSPKGEPLRVEVARGVRADLDEAAVAAVRQWTFEAGSKNGAPVTAWMTVAVPFEASRK